MKSLKRMLAVVLAVVMMMGLGVTSMAAEDGSKEYLADLNGMAEDSGFQDISENLIDFKSNALEYSIIVPQNTRAIGLKAKLSETAPADSKITAYYTYRLQGNANPDSTVLKKSKVRYPISILDDTVDGAPIEIKAGVEGDADADIQEDIQTYMIYVHKEGTKSALLTTKLEALPEVSALTLTDKDAVAEARAAYDELTDAQKELITPSLVQKLTDSRS